MFIDPSASAEFISTSLYKSVSVQPLVPEGLMYYTKCSDQGLDSPPIPSVNSPRSPGHSSFWQLQIRQLFFLQRLQNVDKCPCDGCVCFERRAQILFHWTPHAARYKAASSGTQRKTDVTSALLRPNACECFVLLTARRFVRGRGSVRMQAAECDSETWY